MYHTHTCSTHCVLCMHVWVDKLCAVTLPQRWPATLCIRTVGPSDGGADASDVGRNLHHCMEDAEEGHTEECSRWMKQES